MARLRSLVTCWLSGIAAALQSTLQQVDGPSPHGASAASNLDSAILMLEELVASDRILGRLPKDEVIRRFLAIPVKFNHVFRGHAVASQGDLPRPHECAMVSNGQSLKLTSAGEKIDKVDGLVMRFNRPAMRGWDKEVGTRTDILVVNDLIPCVWMRRGWGPPRDTKYVLLNDFGPQRKIPDECIEHLFWAFPHVQFFSVDFKPLNLAIKHLTADLVEPDAQHLILLKKREITSGMVGLAFALSICERVLHYGFLPVNGTFDNCRLHYWDTPYGKTNDCNKTDPSHFLSDEHVLWAALSGQGSIPGEGVVTHARLQEGPALPGQEQVQAPAK